jgi:hypothetical protein
MPHLSIIKHLFYASLCGSVFASAAIACTQPARPAYKQLYLVYKDRKAGYIDSNGKIAIKPSYRSSTYFREGFAIVSLDDDKRFFIDSAGRRLAAPDFEEAWLFNEGLAGVRINGKWGFIDRRGKLVIPAKFDAADSFCGGLAVVAVKKGDKLKFGFIDKTGKYTVQPKFNYITAFADGIAQFSNDAEYIQKSTYFVVDTTAHYGLIDSAGKIVAEPKFNKIETFHEGFAEAVLGGKTGFIDKTGKWLEGFDGHVKRWFSEGLAAVYMPGKGYGYMDKNAKFVIEPKFIEGKEFSGGLAPVKTEKGWGYINKSGKMVIAPQFSEGHPFVGPLAMVYVTTGKVDPKDNFPEILYGYIDKTGKYVWKPAT